MLLQSRVALLIVSALALFTPFVSYAVGSEADAMCNPVQTVCGCGMVPNPKGGCMGGANMFQCPCSDMTSGFTTSGICVAANKCLAQSTGGGSITQISQLLSAVGQILGMLKGGGGGDSGGSGAGPGSGCTTYTQTSVPNSSDPCSYYVPGLGTSSTDLLSNSLGSGGSGSSAANDLISSLIGSGNSNTNSNSNTNTNSSTTSTSGNTSGSIVPTSSSILATVTGVTNPQSLTPGTSATVSQSAFGNAPGITGDIQVLSGNRVTMLASNRDVSGNKQTSGFFGFGTAVGEDTAVIYTQVCSARQWATNFLATIIPATYLDNLCASHGYSVSPPQLQSATPPPAPSAAPSASQATSTPKYLGPMSADIWASPTSVSSGSRASIFWSAKGVLSCAVSNDSGVMASALSGNASTLPLTHDANFSIVCHSATSSVSDQVTVKVQ